MFFVQKIAVFIRIICEQPLNNLLLADDSDKHSYSDKIISVS